MELQPVPPASSNMTYPVWIKNSKGKYVVNPIGDKIKLLRKLPNGNWGCFMSERVRNKALGDLLCKRPDGLFKYVAATSGSNGTYELKLD